MKFYKNENNEVYAYESDGSQDTYISASLIPITEAEADELRKPPPPRIEQIRTNLSNSVQTMLDTKAQERNYDDIKSACTYVTSTNPQFAAEAQACVAWRDAVWAMCYDLLDKVSSGEIPVLTEAELLAALPKLEWPEVDGTVVEEGVTVQAEQNN